MKEIHSKLSENTDFKNLLKKKNRFSWFLSLLVLGIYFAFILVVAFVPSLLSSRVIDDCIVTSGMPVGIAVILLLFLFTWLYVKKSEDDFDKEKEEIINSLEKQE